MNRSCFIISILFLLLPSCEKGFLIDCKKCVPEGISGAQLVIYISDPDAWTVSRMITIYEGAIEDDLILYKFSSQEEVVRFDAMLYKNYTVSVEYIIEGQRYIAIDAACPQVRYDKNTCEEPCYYVYDNIIDLRLRYH